MKNNVILIAVFLLASILRFWHIGANPPSLDWDEASLGYNAYSILKTGKDEYGTFLPLSIRSFNDYKPPLYTYLTTLPVAVFGLNEFSARVVSAILGTISVLLGFLLVKELFSAQSNKFYQLFTYFFAVSPWHIQFSRVAFEANTGLFFVLLGILFFMKGLKKGTYFLLSACSFSLSLYAYHSPRLVVPLLLIGFTIIYLRQIISHLLASLFALIILLLSLAPLAIQLRNATTMRLGSVTVLNPNERLGDSIKYDQFDREKGDFIGKLAHNRRIVYAREILAGYLDHFNPEFLFISGDAAGRHHAFGMGNLYFFDFLFICMGIYTLLRKTSRNVKAVFWWFLVAPAASAITTATPHAVRSLLFLPLYQIFIAAGILTFIRVIKKRLIPLVIVIFLLNFFYYLHMYWIHTPVVYAQWWQYGYKELVSEVSKIEDRFDKIIVTYAYDQPYVYFSFYKKIDPVWFQAQYRGEVIARANRSIGKYEFRDVVWEKDRNLENTLIVGSPKEIPPEASGLVKEIKFPDGSIAFRVVAR